MKGHAGHNRAICDGDRGRMMSHSDPQNATAVRIRISKWSTKFLETFLRSAHTASHLWKATAAAELETRLLPKKKNSPKTKRPSAPKTPGHRVTKPAKPAAALPTVGL